MCITTDNGNSCKKKKKVVKLRPLPKKRSTSIEFTPESGRRLEKLLIRDSMKNIVSAGIVLFSESSAEDQTRAILIANDESD
jgi:hypothetical protein